MHGSGGLPQLREAQPVGVWEQDAVMERETERAVLEAKLLTLRAVNELTQERGRLTEELDAARELAQSASEQNAVLQLRLSDAVSRIE
eukprot:gene42774-30651_t